jgi:hypothetical protein
LHFLGLFRGYKLSLPQKGSNFTKKSDDFSISNFDLFVLSEQEATHRAFRVACGIHLGPKKREVGELYALFRHTSKLFLGKSCEVF